MACVGSTAYDALLRREGKAHDVLTASGLARGGD